MIWLTGCNGQLGATFARVLKNKRIDFVGTGSEVNLCNEKLLTGFVDKYNFDFVINCAAYTNVDRAEEEIEAALAVNAKALENIARAVSDEVLIIHYSTDYVFDGTKAVPYVEDDRVNPISKYGVSKLSGERILQFMHRKSIILRISWLYGHSKNNFVCKILDKIRIGKEFSVVSDQIGCTTYTEDIVDKTLSILNMPKIDYGIYHYQDKGQISWFDLACKINDLALKIGFVKEKCKIMPVLSNSFKTLAKRPLYSVMNESKFEKNTGLRLNSWDYNLELFLNRLHETVT